MKLLKPIGYLILIAASLYATLWYGFYKGLEYGFSGRMLEAEQARSVLVELRNGEFTEAIESLEMQMNGNILAAYYSDNDIGKYIIGPTMPPSDADQTFAIRIQEYMQKHPYKCHPDKETCAAIKGAIDDMAGTTLNTVRPSAAGAPQSGAP